MAREGERERERERERDGGREGEKEKGGMEVNCVVNHLFGTGRTVFANLKWTQ